MQRDCDVCGTAYEAKRNTSRYCSSTCRAKRSLGVKAVPIQDVTGPDRVVFSSLTETVTAELESAGRLSTSLGQQAVALATMIAAGGQTGSAIASLSRELRAVMAEALAGTKAASDPLDELRQRRERKRATG